MIQNQRQNPKSPFELKLEAQKLMKDMNRDYVNMLDQLDDFTSDRKKGMDDLHKFSNILVT